MPPNPSASTRPAVSTQKSVTQHTAAELRGDGARVQLVDLRRNFGSVRALDGFSLDIEPGEFVALLGPSGCGKTTALRCLAGFEFPDSGGLLVDGRDISSVAPQRRDMGMVFQSYSLFPNMTVADNVGFGLRLRRQAPERRRTRARELLGMVGLADTADRYPHQLSGGQQQRVALARALAIEPRLLLLDEPLSALDAKVRVQLREQIRVLQTRLAITTIFVTHDQEEALSMADRVCVMREGRVEQIDAPSVLYSEPATPFVAEFVGVMNRIPAVVVGGGVDVLGCTARLQGERKPVGSKVHALVRPEGLHLEPAAGGRGIVMTKSFLGSITRVGVLFETEDACASGERKAAADATTIVQIDLPSSVAAELDSGTQVQLELREQSVMVAYDVDAA